MLPHPLTGEPFESPVPPGMGWPGDPASPQTPAAQDADDVRRLAESADLAELGARVSVCRACPRLVEWREGAAVAKRASYADQPYWGRPAPGWGDAEASILFIGLAPAANGANRTGRVFTGDPSGDWLFASLHRTGLAVQPRSDHAGDGQRLVGARMVASVRCAPPANRPTPEEKAACLPWVSRELALLRGSVRVVVALGAIGWRASLEALAAAGLQPAPSEGRARRPKFGHGSEVLLSGRDGRTVTLLGCYHPSPHNTFTGRLTPAQTDAIFRRAQVLAGTPDGGGAPPAVTMAP